MVGERKIEKALELDELPYIPSLYGKRKYTRFLRFEMQLQAWKFAVHI